MERKVKAHQFAGEVLAIRTGGPHAVLELSGPAALARMDPGQFVMLVCDHPEGGRAPSPLVSRPFSVSDVWMEGDRARFTVLSKAIGRGTRWLSERRPGERVQCFGPLGTGLAELSNTRKNVILAGGGSGIAPLPLFTRRLAPAGKRCFAVVGANVVADLPLELPYHMRSSQGEQALSHYLNQAIEPLGAEYHAVLMEERGGYERGTAIDSVRGILEKTVSPGEATIIACGPWGMMRAAHHLAGETGAECLVLLESMMACGIGVCRSCVCEGYRRNVTGNLSAETQNKTVCTDGPLFDSREIVWGEHS